MPDPMEHNTDIKALEEPQWATPYTQASLIQTPQVAPNQPPHERRIRSFVVRTGRMTLGQQRGLQVYWQTHGLELTKGPLSLETCFAKVQPCVLEIGFGMGQSLLEQAQKMPETNFIGIEVHAPGVGKLLAQAGDLGLDNLKVYQADAIQVLEQAIPEASLAGVQVFFPDPWPKKKHHKRRIVQPPFVDLIHSRLQVGGHLHLATDWQPYAEHMLEVLQAASGWRNCAATGDYIERPSTRPLTKFEHRGHKLGHGVWDLLFERQ